MPYIKKEERIKFDNSALTIASNASNCGDLNYAITVIIQEYIKKKGLNYATLNDVHGMLYACNAELYRRITGPYENTKVEQNGDVNRV
jgi:hypothetical protein